MTATQRANVVSLSLQEKLEILDKEFADAYLKHKSAGCDDKMMEEVMFPITKLAKKVFWKAQAKRLLVLGMVACFVFAASSSNVASRVASVACRKVMVNWFLPRYDWTWVWTSECLFENPWYEDVPESLDEETCETCRNLTTLQPLHNVNMTYLSKTIFRSEVTYITDAMIEWPAMNDAPLTLNDLINLFFNNEQLLANHVCSLRVSGGLEDDKSFESVQELFHITDDQVANGEDGNFTATWMMCNRNTSRILHKYYYQPSFLPGMCEPAKETNFVLAGRKSSVKTRALAFRVDATGKGYYIAQVHGTMEILLKPKQVCRDICENIKLRLEKGHILNVPNVLMYMLAFRPASDTAVALAIPYTYEAFFDACSLAVFGQMGRDVVSMVISQQFRCQLNKSIWLSVCISV